jgi:orotidine-5'-phosphate decarboxylase
MNRQSIKPVPEATPVIVALDFGDLTVALKLARELKPQTPWFKVGCQLFARHGYQAVKELRSLDCKVFVDLKVNGLPVTDYHLGKLIGQLGVDLVDIHVALGSSSLNKFISGLRETSGRLPKVLGVTVLTSKSDASHISPEMNRIDTVLHLAHQAKEAGLDGVVAAVSDTRLLKERLGSDFLVLTPGIRPANEAKHEQLQAATPVEAVVAGSDYLVIGRPITSASSPARALEEIRIDISKTDSENKPSGRSTHTSSNSSSWYYAIR